MRNQQLVQQHYDIALKFMQTANYLDAWKNFDKVCYPTFPLPTIHSLCL